MKLMHVVVDVHEEQIRAGRYFLHEPPLGGFIMVGPSLDCTTKDQRCVRCIFTDVLLSSEDRDEE